MPQCEKAHKQQPCCRRRGRAGGGSVEPAALAALLFAGGHGYDMRKDIATLTEGAVEVDVGGLYRALRRLEDEGAVVSRWHEDSSGPPRREYELTQHGYELAEEWLDILRKRERSTRVLGDVLEMGLRMSTADASCNQEQTERG